MLYTPQVQGHAHLHDSLEAATSNPEMKQEVQYVYSFSPSHPHTLTPTHPHLGVSAWRNCTTATPLLESGSGLARVADAVKSVPR